MRYLDHNATTPLDPRVRDAVIAALADPLLQGNPASVHSTGQRARAAVEQARRAVARALGAEALEVTFTSGGTEADNLALIGAARALRAAGRPCGLLTSPLEHPAVLAAAGRLQREGHPLALVAVDAQGRIEADALRAALRANPETGVVSLAAANHVLGNTYDIPGLVRVVREVAPTVLVHCDAVQAFGKLNLDFHAWDLDLLSVSSHKIYGPKGVGALVHRRRLALDPLLLGGQQERGRRAGTESVANLAGFGLAAQLAAAELPARHAHVVALADRLRAGLANMSDATVHGDRERRVGNTVSVGFEGCDGQLLAMNLDLAGIAVSYGAACSSGTPEPSPVLLALGLTPAAARSALRISLGAGNTEDDVDALLAALPEAIARVRGAEGGGDWREVTPS
ncbi:cysteine desulfurase family protein [Nannocystis sp. RBIL2]|uniref:cysteine desulfurase family protein n=1 Tax=Nannocystis sp. RBIL2 TaxID=2996788 RepID=UPI002271616A|nr:cysteine desulfurase family protein [Nannocystis sp. RBIL2]